MLSVLDRKSYYLVVIWWISIQKSSLVLLPNHLWPGFIWKGLLSLRERLDTPFREIVDVEAVDAEMEYGKLLLTWKIIYLSSFSVSWQSVSGFTKMSLHSPWISSWISSNLGFLRDFECYYICTIFVTIFVLYLSFKSFVPRSLTQDFLKSTLYGMYDWCAKYFFMFIKKLLKSWDYSKNEFWKHQVLLSEGKVS